MSEVELVTEFDKLKGIHAPTGTFVQASGSMRREKSVFVYGVVKRIIDVSIALTALIILSPMLILVGAILLVTQGGPILISHRRVGKGGGLFPCLKFRTMVVNSDEVLARHLALHPELKAEWDATRKLKEDPRVTAFGQSLRRSSIDEIPQLLNVIRGEMSLVGPRPITLGETEFYGARYSAYTSVRPGLTGLWQISGRSEIGYAERVDLDVRYIEERGLWGDFIIMLRTLPVVASSRGSY